VDGASTNDTVSNTDAALKSGLVSDRQEKAPQSIERDDTAPSISAKGSLLTGYRAAVEAVIREILPFVIRLAGGTPRL
jgi:hypothetical protein